VSTFAVLRHPAFRLLLTGRTLSTLGNTIAPIALAFAVLDLTGSATDLGLVVGARTVANVAFLLFGGVLADRLPRHLMMVGASVMAAATQGTVAALILTHTATVPLLIALEVANGMVSALTMPASAAILPQTVPADERQQANALSRLFFNAAAIVGAPVGGVVVATVGSGWGIAVDAVTFLLAGACYALLRVPKVALPSVIEGRKSILADLLTGWGEFRSRTWLWVIVLGFCIVNACWSGAIYVLGPTVANGTIGRQAWGFVLGAQTVGMIIGALIAMRVRLRRMLFFGTACTALLALPMVVLGAAPLVVPLVAAAFVSGVGLEQFAVAWETTMQEHIAPEKLARVYSYDMVGSFIAMPVGEVVAGPVSQAVGIETTLLAAAALVVLSVVGMLSSRDVRTLEHRVSTAPMEQLPA
jgi:MFS family permease